MIISQKTTGLASLTPKKLESVQPQSNRILPSEQMTFSPASNPQSSAPIREQKYPNQNKTVSSQQSPSLSIPIHDLNQLRQIKKSIQKSALAHGLISSEQSENMIIEPTKQVVELEKVKKQLLQIRPQSSNLGGGGGNGLFELPRLQILQNGGKQSQKHLMVQIRQHFMNLLGKLIDLQTREVANSQLKDMIMNNFSSEYLRIWISALSEYHSRPSNFSSSETEILLIGHIASIYRDKLLDPADKPPSIIKTSYKLCEMIQKYFYAKQVNENIHRACASSWCSIYKYCLQNEQIESKEMVLFTTLKNIINGGGDRVAQITALFVLDSFLQLLVEFHDDDLISLIARSYFHSILTRSRIDSPSIIRCSRHIIESLHVKSLMIYISLIIEKSVFYLTEKQISYKVKIAACELLELIANQLFECTENLVGSYHETVIPVLSNSTRDRIMHVQNAAKQALMAWNKLKNSIEQLEQYKLHKTQKILPSKIDVDQLIEERTNENNQLSKEEQQQQQNKRQVFKNQRQNLSTSNFLVKSEQIRGKQDYIKKKSGTGGGFPLSVPEQQKISIQSTYLHENNKLKEFIFNSRTSKNDFVSSIGLSVNDIENSGVQDTITDSPREEEIKPTTFKNILGTPYSLYPDIKLLPQKIKFKIEPDFDSVQNPNVIPPTSLKDKYDFQVVEDELSETVDLNRVSLKEAKNLQGILRPPSIGKSKLSAPNVFEEEHIDDCLTAAYSSLNLKSQNIALTTMWNDVLELADSGQFEKAFSRVIDSGDDIYLIRIMVRNRNGFKHLQRQTQLTILKKIITFMQSNFLSRLCIGFFQDSVDCGLTKFITDADQTAILEILYEMSELKSDIAPKACNLFSYFQSKTSF